MTFLREELNKRNWSVRQLARQSGVSSRTLERYVSGTRSFSSANFLFAISVADALNIDPHKLLSNEYARG